MAVIRSGQDLLNSESTNLSQFADNEDGRWKLKSPVTETLDNPEYEAFIADGWELIGGDAKEPENWRKTIIVPHWGQRQDTRIETLPNDYPIPSKTVTKTRNYVDELETPDATLQFMSDEDLANTSFELLYGAEGETNPVAHPWKIGYELEKRTGKKFPDNKSNIQRPGGDDRASSEGAGKDLLTGLQDEMYNRLESIWTTQGSSGDDLYNTVFPGYTPGAKIRHVSGGIGGVTLAGLSTIAKLGGMFMGAGALAGAAGGLLAGTGAAAGAAAATAGFGSFGTAMQLYSLGEGAYATSQDPSAANIINLVGRAYGLGGKTGAWELNPAVNDSLYALSKTAAVIQNPTIGNALAAAGAATKAAESLGVTPDTMTIGIPENIKKVVDTGIDAIGVGVDLNKAIENKDIGALIQAGAGAIDLARDTELVDSTDEIINNIGNIGKTISSAEQTIKNPSIGNILNTIDKTTEGLVESGYVEPSLGQDISTGVQLGGLGLGAINKYIPQEPSYPTQQPTQVATGQPQPPVEPPIAEQPSIDASLPAPFAQAPVSQPPIPTDAPEPVVNQPLPVNITLPTKPINYADPAFAQGMVSSIGQDKMQIFAQNLSKSAKTLYNQRAEFDSNQLRQLRPQNEAANRYMYRAMTDMSKQTQGVS